MSVETALAIATACGTFTVSCVFIGITIGKLQSKVDTLQRDMNAAFKMIREKF